MCPLRSSPNGSTRSGCCILPLVVATFSAVYIWHIQTGNLICTLGTQSIEDHKMVYEGVEVSRELIVAFDSEQIRFFSGQDGLLLSFLSQLISTLESIPRGVQLLPPRNGVTPLQCPEAVLLQQILFKKRRQWSRSRGQFTHVRISPCGMTLVILSSKRRRLIVNDIRHVIMEDPPTFDAAVDVKIPRHYGSSACLTMTRDRIAVARRNPHPDSRSLNSNAWSSAPVQAQIQFVSASCQSWGCILSSSARLLCGSRAVLTAGCVTWSFPAPSSSSIASLAESTDDGSSEASNDPDALPHLFRVPNSDSSSADNEVDSDDNDDDAWLDLDRGKERAEIDGDMSENDLDWNSSGATYADNQLWRRDSDSEPEDDSDDDAWLDLDRGMEGAEIDSDTSENDLDLNSRGATYADDHIQRRDSDSEQEDADIDGSTSDSEDDDDKHPHGRRASTCMNVSLALADDTRNNVHASTAGPSGLRRSYLSHHCWRKSSRRDAQ
ncbi:hypothetical protein B0H13DRAFT_2015164 [Mycena leptocephala]|nr:hypothetical protein B0H13DRAFT_2015164 [Mycena leptocephala]